ncbi:MAG: hypothetical protein U9N59_12880 [Campylobacterota bacterium]|nr:hypothetical protein [Campylobacterota bacterium]
MVTIINKKVVQNTNSYETQYLCLNDEKYESIKNDTIIIYISLYKNMEDKKQNKIHMRIQKEVSKLTKFGVKKYHKDSSQNIYRYKVVSNQKNVEYVNNVYIKSIIFTKVS